MNLLRAAAAGLALLATPVLAQQPQPGLIPQTKPDPEVVDRPETPEEKLQRLTDQVRRLEEELAFLQRTESAGGLLANIKRRLHERTLSPTQADDPGAGQKNQAQAQPTGDTATAPAPVAPTRKARLLGDGEKEKLPEGTIFTVDGLRVLESEFQELYTYLRGLPTGETEEETKTQTVEALIRRKAAEAAFPEGAARARDRMVQAQQMLKGGADFAEIASKLSDCPSKTKGGDLGFMGRKTMDVHFAKAAFSLKDGEVGGPFQSSFGYHLIKRTGFKKGDDAGSDQVRCSHILALYAEDQFQVRAVQDRVNQAQLDLAFVSDDYRKLAPASFR
ncbi:MAG TPA: peptidylprolyl isomerase [Planctomycetota bacterium]|nr:peptidylprolyl isomerase [Planctomycetota bacterium]